MDHPMAIVGAILVAVALLMIGYMAGSKDTEAVCAEGSPMVIKKSVYRCVMAGK